MASKRMLARYKRLMDKSRAQWARGPWDDEPDRVEWRDRKTGLPCLIVRSGMGSLCGYVGVPKGHPLYGRESQDQELALHAGHSEINYAKRCEGVVCHTPRPGEARDVWWLGFDCGHTFDLVPALEPIYQKVDAEHAGRLDDAMVSEDSHLRDIFRRYYRDVAYVKAAVTDLAAEIAAKAE